MDKKNQFLTIPNILSCLRILLIPFFIAMVLRHKPWWSLFIFILAGFTDILDGLTARIWHQKSKMGSYLDPTGDKLLLTAAFILLSFPSLSTPNTIPSWLTFFVIGRDVLIVFSAFIINQLTGQTEFTPTITGKASTICQMGVLFLVLFYNYLETSPAFFQQLFQLTLILTLISAVHYGFVGFRMFSRRVKKTDFL